MYVIADVNSFVVTWGLPSPKKIKKKRKVRSLGTLPASLGKDQICFITIKFQIEAALSE